MSKDSARRRSRRRLNSHDRGIDRHNKGTELFKKQSRLAQEFVPQKKVNQSKRSQKKRSQTKVAGSHDPEEIVRPGRVVDVVCLSCGLMLSVSNNPTIAARYPCNGGLDG